MIYSNEPRYWHNIQEKINAMNLAFQNRFHYFCSIKKHEDSNKIEITFYLTETHSYFDTPLSNSPPDSILQWKGAFNYPTANTASNNGQPGKLACLTIDMNDINSIESISNGIITSHLTEIILMEAETQHIKLIKELTESYQSNEIARLTTQRIIHLYASRDASFHITISIDAKSLNRDHFTHNFPGQFFECPIGETIWKRQWNNNFRTELYIAKQIYSSIKNMELDIIHKIVDYDTFFVFETFVLLTSQERLYQEYKNYFDRLCEILSDLIPEYISIRDALHLATKTVDDLEKIWSRYWVNSLDDAKLIIGSWLMNSAYSALACLENIAEAKDVLPCVQLLSFSDLFPNLTDDFQKRLSNAICDFAKKNQASLLLSFFLDSFQYKSHQLNAIHVLVDDYFPSLEDVATGHLRSIALLYFYGMTKKHLESSLGTDVFEYDHDYLEITNKITSQAKNFPSFTIERLKKFLKLGEYNKILFILYHTHMHLDRSPTQGELIRLYTKCHMIVGSNIRWDSIWVFGKTLNDIDLLESFALNLLETASISSAEKVIQHIKNIEPHSDCIAKLQAKLSRTKSIELLRNEGVEFERIQLLSGIEFEDLISTSFEKLNLKTYKTPATGDFGADLIVEDSEGTRYIIQCKRFKAKVNLKAVQEVVAAKMHYSGDYGIVITNSEFLASAIELAKSNQIELWNGDKLISFLSGNIEFSVLSDSIRNAAIASDNPKKNN